MKQAKDSPSIVAIIATKNRPILLKDRALKSILNQKRFPSEIIIIDDSDEKYQDQNRKIADEIGTIIKCTYLKNQRTPGASGAWNTGITHVFKHSGKPSNIYIAILDDDDEWLPDYLNSCFRLISENPNIDWIVPDFHRVETSRENPFFQEAPKKVFTDLFIVGNPGIQGSNLFLRLSTFLEAGCFDENLSSCTDRDLCIRLCDLGDIAYTRLPEIMMLHYAEPQRLRLSTPHSPNKMNGLTAFWLKYHGRMTEAQREAFCSRSKLLFNWLPSNTTQRKEHLNSRDNEKATGTITAPPKNIEAFHLLVGVISGDTEKLGNLISSLRLLSSLKCLSSINITVLCNGIGASVTLESIANCSLNIQIIPEKKQIADATSGLFGENLKTRPTGIVGIAQARTMLQKYVGLKMLAEPNSVAWILDDDMRIDERALNYIPWLPEFKKEGVDILMGCYTGSSPNPPLNGLRVLLVDMLQNILWLKKLNPESPLPNRSKENLKEQQKYLDYYYDLSRKHTGHLEAPHWIEPAFEGETVSEAYARLLRYAPLIVTGHPFTRSIKAPRIQGDPINNSKPSVNRGGTTFIFNPDALLNVPNSIPKIRGREARRSDMMWAIMNRHLQNMDVRAIAFPILHDGRVTIEKHFIVIYRSDSETGSAKIPSVLRDDMITFIP